MIAVPGKGRPAPTREERKAALFALDRVWSTTDGSISGAFVAGIYRKIESTQPLGLTSGRREDRALQLLRKSGLIEYDKAARTWRVTAT